MNVQDFPRYTVAACTAVTLLVGCSGSQSQMGHPPITTPGTSIRYSVEALTTPLGGGVAEGVSNQDWIAGSTNGLRGCCVSRAALWRNGNFTDLGTLGGPNSSEQWPVKDNRGLIAGVAETSKPDPLNEDFCGFGTGLICLGFLWQDGKMHALPTLGGNNGQALGVNNRRQVVGYAETTTHDTCFGQHVVRFEAVVWGPKPGEIRKLAPMAGDTVSGASGINDREQVAGVSGLCSDPPRHAVLWHDGTVTDLGNLGGHLNNFAWAINANGDVVGQSGVPHDNTTHAFLWTKHKGMQDLGTVVGDHSSLAFSLNNRGQVVGGSCVSLGSSFQHCRAFLWQNGAMVDLNDLICSPTSLHLYFANDINDHGTIVGFAFDRKTRHFRPFLASPKTIASGTKNC